VSNKSRGLNRERQVRDWFEKRDWLVVRAAGSLGDVDLVCMKDGNTPLLVEVKSTAAGPYHSFGPASREELRLAARLAGANATLAWWPPRGQLRFIPSREWPGSVS
jgi:Holliday junction resolvase